MNMEEAFLVVHFLELAQRKHTYPDKSVAVVCTHYAQMLLLQCCIGQMAEWLGEGRYACVSAISTLDHFQGLQAQVVVASLVSAAPGIMLDVVRANTLISRAQSELHLIGHFEQWRSRGATGSWLKGVEVVQDKSEVAWDELDDLILPKVLCVEPLLPEWKEGVMRMRVQQNDVTPHHLGVTLPDFTQWALPYVLLEGDSVDEELSGLERVTHAAQLSPDARVMVQKLIHKPLGKAQSYEENDTAPKWNTIHLKTWQEAYRGLTSLPFLLRYFCSPLGVHVAMLLHGIVDCSGEVGVCCPVPVHRTRELQCAWRPLPEALKDYIYGV